MSGPCTDCGGPDYQTLEARIAELGEQINADSEGMDEQKARIAGLEAENASMADDICSLTTAHDRAEQAEAALAEANAKYRAAVECSQDERDRAVAAEATLAERDRMLRLAWQTAAYVRGLDFPDWLVDLCARAERNAP